MQIITLILAVLALAASAVNLVLSQKERARQNVREKKRQKALLQYVDQAADAAVKKAAEYTHEQFHNAGSDIGKIRKAVQAVNGKAVVALKTAREFSDRIEKLEQGVIPDYNEALKAVNAVNDMNSGIAGIFGFDPLEALKKSRQEGK